MRKNKTITNLEKIAKLKLNDNEIDIFEKDLSIFIKQLDQLNNLDFKNLNPSFLPFDIYSNEHLFEDNIQNEYKNNKFFFDNSKNNLDNEIALTSFSPSNPNHNVILENHNSTIKTNIPIVDKKMSRNYGLKDNFAINGSFTMNGSRILQDFKTNYDSTVYTLLQNKGYGLKYKTNLDELAMGGTGLSSGFGVVPNSINEDYICGGSSSGSAYVVSKDLVSFSIGTDTGDSVRKPASLNNIVGFKPTWGLISRKGVYDFAPSLDTVGWFTKNIAKSIEVFDILNEFDYEDSSSVSERKIMDLNDSEKPSIGYIPYILENSKESIKKDFISLLKSLEEKGHKIKKLDVDNDLLSKTLLMYKCITCVEGFSSNANLTGFIFGNSFDTKSSNFEEGIINARTNSFKYEIKKRFLFGAYIISKGNYYINSLKLRTKFINEINKWFNQIDIFISPSLVVEKPALISDYDLETENFDSYKSYLNDFMSWFNFNGSPSISFPINKNSSKEFKTSIIIATKPFSDYLCLKFAKKIEEIYE